MSAKNTPASSAGDAHRAAQKHANSPADAPRMTHTDGSHRPRQHGHVRLWASQRRMHEGWKRWPQASWWEVASGRRQIGHCIGSDRKLIMYFIARFALSTTL